MCVCVCFYFYFHICAARRGGVDLGLFSVDLGLFLFHIGVQHLSIVISCVGVQRVQGEFIFGTGGVDFCSGLV